MGGLEVRELECFLVLADELHFGRAADRLYVSQSRVSQLLRALERRVGARLVERTSRRVRLTPLGEAFLRDLRPAYDGLAATVERARMAALGVHGRLRVGFQGAVHEGVLSAITDLQEGSGEGIRIDIVEIPLCDPFGALRRGEVDAAGVLLPVEEPGLVLGPVFSRRPQTLAVAACHPFAERASVTAEELAGTPLVSVGEPAPAYWSRAHAPGRTPGGRPIPPGVAVRTLQEGLTAIASGRGAMLLCLPTAEYNRRGDIAFVPVTGMPDSSLGLVWRQGHETPAIRSLAEALALTA
ncbi:LysR family transcriptional regulator [Nocardiopsis sediminis]|uniref:LysR family transcriptional regulator n=1 Tax=Nocardiopsis sediminis TaxID=1778267 RepID=A0ABV8FRI1_9ACTN